MASGEAFLCALNRDRVSGKELVTKRKGGHFKGWLTH